MKFTTLFIALIAGVLFGIGMNVSGMVDPNNIFSFLDITGSWDPSLAFVMGGALAVFVPFHYFLIKPRAQSINGSNISTPENNKIDKRLVMGASIFGLGWGIGGICPGPAVASLGGASITIIVFTICMVIGMKATTLLSKTC
ncbi:DUF6691 family protein [Vibrio sp. 10N.261.46.E12]|uniref:YeeE/YedE family protein n=1 Tax=unclassified Vibrio TaxID=2614977 RepID=UPI0009768ECD|nr:MULTISPECIES: YeeE/YedE family protein [unclassified Vibrio]OMO35586.1 hypothetical protein BH584_07945 [Vibrio sp. 10N.261.45.E1]PMJ23476.1 hypothetical protein BCU27_01800 [Vibrio sp. 10N.286.45.B6]PML87468.1 hypothetical protein BCT66_11855 [Vibrio sp. 10N.261.49.E11]PMM73815.1 hypothetical protein BCT48_04175 [Vibrio sp. 10N.261.46.F12]PMM87242.1 hypothetical protein BCT46_06505 [Vibrio sp. 10N.261.46.E8]